MSIPKEDLYHPDHMWVRREGDDAVIGITHFAQAQLGDVMYVDVLEPGDSIHKGEPFGTVESAKSVSELFPPVSGTVIAGNERLGVEPALVNAQPYGDGWILRVRLADAAELDDLMDAEAYARHTGAAV